MSEDRRFGWTLGMLLAVPGFSPCDFQNIADSSKAKGCPSTQAVLASQTGERTSKAATAETPAAPRRENPDVPSPKVPSSGSDARGFAVELGGGILLVALAATAAGAGELLLLSAGIFLAADGITRYATGDGILGGLSRLVGLKSGS